MAESTARTALYRGVIVHEAAIPIMATAWATIGPDTEESDLQDYMIDNLVKDRPGTTRDQYRVIEFTWTEIDPVEIPEVDPQLDTTPPEEEDPFE